MQGKYKTNSNQITYGPEEPASKITKGSNHAQTNSQVSLNLETFKTVYEGGTSTN